MDDSPPSPYKSGMTTRAFIKMHGLGNDFVVFDGRGDGWSPDADTARYVADRCEGVGCDQVITLLPSTKADVFMHIRNRDGSEVEACGNATRCVARLLHEETGRSDMRIETLAGVLGARAGHDYAVDLGVPGLEWQDIPLAREMDTLALDYTKGTLSHPVAVNMGNPHVVFFVADAGAEPLETFGPWIEKDKLFPERTNVSVAQIEGDAIRLRVWERGVGITRACGTAACATGVAAMRLGLVPRGKPVTVRLEGGDLQIDWDANDHVIMTGPAAKVYSGEIVL